MHREGLKGFKTTLFEHLLSSGDVFGNAMFLLTLAVPGSAFDIGI